MSILEQMGKPPLQRLKDKAADPAVPLPDLLQEARGIAQNIPFADSAWIDAELHGYKIWHFVPSYRVLSGNVSVKTHGVIGFPLAFEDPIKGGFTIETAKQKVTNSVPEIQEMIRTGQHLEATLDAVAQLSLRGRPASNPLDAPYDPAKACDEANTEYVVVLPPSALANVLDAVRKRVVDWADSILSPAKPKIEVAPPTSKIDAAPAKPKIEAVVDTKAKEKHFKGCAVFITALGLETEAVLRHLGPDVRDETVTGTVFHRGVFNDWDVAVAEAGKGNARAAGIAERALSHYRPVVAIFVGIAGGIKDVKLGDVVVATKIYGYESGKETDAGFKARPEVQNASHALESRARAMRLKSAWRKRLLSDWTSRAPDLFVGPIAAGEKVLASREGQLAKFLAEHYGDAIAVAMEDYGFLASAQLNQHVYGCVVRGISDLLQGKDKADGEGWQPKAAESASAAAFELLASIAISDLMPAAKSKIKPPE